MGDTEGAVRPGTLPVLTVYMSHLPPIQTQTFQRQTPVERRSSVHGSRAQRSLLKGGSYREKSNKRSVGLQCQLAVDDIARLKEEHAASIAALKEEMRHQQLAMDELRAAASKPDTCSRGTATEKQAEASTQGTSSPQGEP